jgi:DNA-binding PadR family transcriptional regulator
MPDAATQQAERNQDLRHVTLEVLAVRHPAALPLRAISRRVATSLDWRFSDPELLSALEFLVSAGLVKSEYDELGSTRYWLTTAEGVKHYERRL